MSNKEKYGLRILNNCLPPIKYSISVDGETISIKEKVEVIKHTKGKNTPGSRKFLAFLKEHDALFAFIDASFNAAPVYGVRSPRGTPVKISGWIRESFDWMATRDSVDWGELNSMWNDTLPRHHRESYSR